MLHSPTSINLTLTLDLTALPPSPTCPTPTQPPLLSLARLIHTLHVRISSYYSCEPLANLADIFRLVSYCFKTYDARNSMMYCRRLYTLSPRSEPPCCIHCPHNSQVRITGSSKPQDVRGTRNASPRKSNHNPSHTHQREHHSDSVLALFAFVITSTQYSLRIDNACARSLVVGQQKRTGATRFDAGGRITTYCEPTTDPIYVLPTTDPSSARSLVNNLYYTDEPHGLSCVSGMHLVNGLILMSRRVWLSICLSSVCGYAAEFHVHLSLLLLLYCHPTSWVCTCCTRLNNYRPPKFRPFTILRHLP